MSAERTTPKLAIWGASGHARVVYDVIRLVGDYETVGFVDDVSPERAGTTFVDLPVLGGDLGALRDLGVTHAIIAFGDNQARAKLGARLRDEGFVLATACHPRAIIASDARIGEGTVVAAGAVINPNATLGRHVIVNTGATIDHDCVLEDAVHVSPGAHLAGTVTLERCVWIGTGANIVPNVRIGHDTIVGAASLVLHDLPPSVVAYGSPAKAVRARSAD